MIRGGCFSSLGNMPGIWPAAMPLRFRTTLYRVRVTRETRKTLHPRKCLPQFDSTIKKKKPAHNTSHSHLYQLTQVVGY